MRDLHVIVSNKVATYLTRDGSIVCGNSNYRIVFTFDSEWDGHNQKVARFIWNNGYHDVPFTGDTVTVPILNNTKQLKVGVYAGELRTTTPAVIECQLSILCGTTEAKPLIPSQYDEVMARLDELEQNGGGLTNTASALLISILRNGVYTTNQSANITALENALASGGSGDSGGGDTGGGNTETVTYTITNKLTNCSNSNTAATIAKNSAYTAVITAANGYELDSVVVTMGGVAVAVTDGVISIASVTGNIVITASAVEASTGDDTGENNGWTDGEAYAIEWTDGYTVNKDSGENVANTARSVSGFIPVLGVSGLVGGSGINGGYLYAYDADYTYLGRITFETAYPAVVNRNIAYVKIVCLTTDKATATLTPCEYEELTDSTAWEAGKFYQASYLSGKGISHETGVESDKANYWASDFMLCYGAKTITTTQIDYTIWRNWGVFYDADKNYISGAIGNKEPWDVPENAVYFRLSGFDGFEYTIQKPNRPWLKFE